MSLRKNLDLEQTIFARSSGSLPSAVAIEKLSGPATFEIAKKLFFPKGSSSTEQEFQNKRGMWMGELRSGNGKKIDDIMLLSFVAPNSHTGEDTVEFHCHGSIAVIQKLERELLQLGARPARQGEFSYRALLNDKQSPSDIENLGDLFKASQPIDLDRIFARRNGALEEKVLDLRKKMIHAQAILDTAVDFSEEYSSVVSQVEPVVDTVIRECSAITQSYLRFKSGIEIPRLVFAGRPNAGKSSLFNALLGRYRAIVSEEAGTTRDAIEEDAEFNQKKWKVVDTAGIRTSQNEIENKGMELGESFLASSSFWLLVVDGSQGITDEEVQLLEKFHSKPHLILWNKQDLENWSAAPEWLKERVVNISTLTLASMEILWTRLESELAKLNLQDGAPLPTAVQATRLEKILEELWLMKSEIQNETPPEILAEKNRALTSHIEGLIGTVGTEDVLDRIFSDFCIGK